MKRRMMIFSINNLIRAVLCVALVFGISSQALAKTEVTAGSIVASFSSNTASANLQVKITFQAANNHSSGETVDVRLDDNGSGGGTFTMPGSFNDGAVKIKKNDDSFQDILGTNVTVGGGSTSQFSFPLPTGFNLAANDWCVITVDGTQSGYLIVAPSSQKTNIQTRVKIGDYGAQLSDSYDYPIKITVSALNPPTGQTSVKNGDTITLSGSIISGGYDVGDALTIKIWEYSSQNAMDNRRFSAKTDVSHSITVGSGGSFSGTFTLPTLSSSTIRAEVFVKNATSSPNANGVLSKAQQGHYGTGYSLTVDNTAPTTCELIHPTTSTVIGASYTLEATAPSGGSDATMKEVRWYGKTSAFTSTVTDGTLIGTDSNTDDGTYTYNWTNPGTYTYIRSVAFDNALNGTVSGTASGLSYDTTPPTLSSPNPADGGRLYITETGGATITSQAISFSTSEQFSGNFRYIFNDSATDTSASGYKNSQTLNNVSGTVTVYISMANALYSGDTRQYRYLHFYATGTDGAGNSLTGEPISSNPVKAVEVNDLGSFGITKSGTVNAGTYKALTVTARKRNASTYTTYADLNHTVTMTVDNTGGTETWSGDAVNGSNQGTISYTYFSSGVADDVRLTLTKKETGRTITATDGSNNGTLTSYDISYALETTGWNLSISPGSQNVVTDQSFSITATLLDTYSNKVDGQTITFSLSDGSPANTHDSITPSLSGSSDSNGQLTRTYNVGSETTNGAQGIVDANAGTSTSAADVTYTVDTSTQTTKIVLTAIDGNNGEELTNTFTIHVQTQRANGTPQPPSQTTTYRVDYSSPAWGGTLTDCSPSNRELVFTTSDNEKTLTCTASESGTYTLTLVYVSGSNLTVGYTVQDLVAVDTKVPGTIGTTSFQYTQGSDGKVKLAWNTEPYENGSSSNGGNITEYIVRYKATIPFSSYTDGKAIANPSNIPTPVGQGG